MIDLSIIRELLKTLSVTNDWTFEYDKQTDSISIAKASDSKVVCYIQIDEYDKDQPLEITDDCITLNEFDLSDSGKGPKPVAFKHIKLTGNQVHAIDHLLSESGISRLISFNEIILDTNQNDINEDLAKYLSTLTMLLDLLNIFRGSQLP